MANGNNTEIRVGWVDPSDGRGTMDIIWACGLTTFLCVWSVLTLNVPAPDTTFWAFTRTKMKWAVITLFGPEVLSGMAGAQWSNARRAKKQFRDGGIKWTMRQSFFADMGGVRVRLRDDEFPVTSKHIYALLSLELVKLDTINPAAIGDRSKTDGVAKLFTILQICWFLLQSVSRLKQHIALTSMELSTIAFIVCTMGTNIMWWHKPKDVFIPIVLEIDCTLEDLLAMTGSRLTEAKMEANNWQWSPLEKFDDLRPNFLVDAGQYLPRKSSFDLSQSAQKKRFRNDRLPPMERDWLLNSFLSVLSHAFGAIYVAGWNLSFPTRAEQIAWRICSTTMFSLVMAYWVVDVGVWLHQKRRKSRGNHKLTPVWMALSAVIGIFYVTVRMYILIEPFVCLRSLPAAAYKTVEWPSFIAHL